MQGEGLRLESALKEEDGRILVKHVRESLSKRIDQLIDADPEAKAYMKILKEMGVKIAMGRIASQNIIMRELKEGSGNGER